MRGDTGDGLLVVGRSHLVCLPDPAGSSLCVEGRDQSPAGRARCEGDRGQRLADRLPDLLLDYAVSPRRLCADGVVEVAGCVVDQIAHRPMGMGDIAGETDRHHGRRTNDGGRHEHRVVDSDRYRLAKPRQHHIGESGNVRGGDDDRLVTVQQRRSGRVGRVEGGEGQDAIGIEIADPVRIGLTENGHLRRRHHVSVDGHLDRDVGIGTDLSADRDGEPSPFGDLHGDDPRGRIAEQRDTRCSRRVELLPDGGRRVGEDQPVRKSVRGGAHGVARHRLQHRELLCRKCSRLDIDDGRPVDT